MKKQILAMSVIAALAGCDLDNKDALQVPATFGNDFTTEVGAQGTTGKGFTVDLTTGHGNANGTFIVNDVNFGEAEPNYDLTPEAMYGTFTLEYLQSGYASWTYDLDETHPDVAAILDNPDASLTEELTITTKDGSTQAITINIVGVDPTLPAEIAGALVANPSIRNTSAFGATSIYDPNFNQSKFVANATYDPSTDKVTPMKDDNGNTFGIVSDNGYGSLYIAESGDWEFKVNKKAKVPGDDTKTLADLLPLPDSDPVSDSVTITSVDGTTKTIQVNIYGAVPNFAPEILSYTDKDSQFEVMMSQLGVNDGQSGNGKITFKVKVTEDIARKATLSFGCSRNFHDSENRRVVTFYIQPTGELQMWAAELNPGIKPSNRETSGIYPSTIVTDIVTFDQSLVPGEWSEFTMTWQGAKLGTKALLHAWLDGEALTSDHYQMPTNPADGFVGPTLAGKLPTMCMNQFRFYVDADEQNGGIGALLVDDIQYYLDVDANPKKDSANAKLNESFANNVVGDIVKDIIVKNKTPYAASSEELKIARD
ncbi:hypothetical protein C2869_06275 [Saccharobesus litoralis]|uniref:Uncharacterized protein n=1 Tax=Saccharobesus litoralis TaxID=2172099 RepID=A0A2S0VPE4_9ALTE|nr:VCBS domain-containing protein [Saccharobesus litoralis]AWB66069.1 hypothetical protein C2869_06275 [Saccharobesus litoralis]